MLAQLIEAGVAPTQARVFAEPLERAFAAFHIDNADRRAAFIAEAGYESAMFTRLEEGLSYRDPERIARIFRTAFDLDRDRAIDAEEIEFARGYVREPKKLANRVYANRLGNGDEDSGDGWLYRGRGLFQLTGRANYMAAGEALHRPYKERPELVAEPLDAAMTAAWYWHTKGLNALADARNIDAITRAVNGPAMLGAAERRVYFDEALEAFA